MQRVKISTTKSYTNLHFILFSRGLFYLLPFIIPVELLIAVALRDKRNRTREQRH